MDSLFCVIILSLKRINSGAIEADLIPCTLCKMANDDKPTENTGDGDVVRDLTAMDLIISIRRLCTEFGLSDKVESIAVSCCENLYRSYGDDMKSNQMNWVACLLYVAAVDARFPYGLSDPQSSCLENMSVTVTELLKTGDIRTTDFFHYMKLLKNAWTLSEAVCHHLRQVEIKFLVSCALFDKFEKMFVDIFDCGDVPISDGLNGLADRKQFCWTLFVYMRALAFSQNKGRQELILAFYLLLCCLDYVIRLTPSFQLRPPFDAVRILVTTSNVEGDVLNELCARFQGNVEEVRLVQSTYFDVLIQDLPQTDSVIDVKKVVEEYVAQYRSSGDINELDFLTRERYLRIVTAHSEVNNNRSNAGTPTTAHSSQQRQTLMTPVKAAMNSIQHLLNLLQTSTENPSAVLNSYLEKCSNNPLPLMIEQLQQVEGNFQTNYVKILGERYLTIGQQRFRLARRLYFHVMESMLKMEEERVASSDFTKLLNQPVFHKSLISCSLEVVLVTYEPHCTVGSNTPSPVVTPGNGSAPASFLFPWILSSLKVHAFDLFKVVDSFVKAEPQLTSDVVKHLHQIENQILECYAWTTGSPVLELLRQSESSSVSLSSSSPRSTSNAVPREGNASDSESPSASPRRSRSLSTFLNKVFKLASQRLQAFCSILHVTGDLQHKIWSCFEYCVVHRPGLLTDRHIDQILMCSVYAISKVVEREIKFKAIVAAYRTIYPSVSQQVFKRVLINDSDYDSIIAFYNKVYMQSLKSFILQYSSSRGAPSSSPGGQPVVAMSPSQMSPSFQIPGRQNFYVSPMKSSPFKTPLSPSLLTPRTRQLFSFGEGPISSLRIINEQRSVLSGSRSSKRLRFEQTEDIEPHAASGSFEFESPSKRKIPASRKSLRYPDPPPSATDGGTDDNLKTEV